MDKEQIPVARLALNEQFRAVMYRTVSILLLRDMNNLEAEYVKKNPYSQPDDFWVKCAEGKYKKHMLQKLNSVQAIKDDIVAEVLKNYGMTGFNDATDYHDLLMELCNEAIEIARVYIRAGRYDGLSLMSATKIGQEGIKFG